TVDEQHRGFYIDNRVSENIVLDGFTIINGYSENLGGGILCDGFPGYGFEMQLAINNCIIRNCQARYNAGIHCAWPFFSPVTISNCVISDNLGSGIYYSGETEINNCVISNNVEHGITGGGGITEIYNCIITDNGGSGISASAYLQISGCTIANNNKSGIKNRGYFTVTDCIIRNNQYSGILNEDGELNLSNSVIRGNYSSTNGGGLSSIGRFEVITVENCVFSDNYAKQNGGGVYSNKGESNDGINKYINCTFIGNIADEYGGGYYGEGWLTEEYLANCIFRGNSASEGLQMGIRDNADVAVAYSNVQGGQEQILVDNSSLSWGQGNIDTDPCFFAYAGDYHQLSNSPCIDAGTNSPTGGLPETDIYGRDRCQDGDGDGNSIADMGAYEFEYDSNTPIIVSYQDFFEFYKFNDQPTSDQYLSIRNCAGGRLNWEIIADCSWLQAVPDSGSSTGEVNEVAIRVDTTNLTHGDYSGKLTIIDANAVNSPRTVLIKLHVGGNLFVPEQYPTIQEAIDAANDGSIIIVADGIYTGTGNKNINFKRKAIRLRSENGPDNCIIDCENDGQGFIFDRNEKTDSVLDGFTIANAYNKTYPHGGGIYIGDSSPVIENCKIINCEAYKLYGGGIYSGGGSPVIRNCFISGNSSRSGGGLYFSGGEIDHCTIVGNKTYYGYGGGIHNSGKATYKNCLIVNNVSAKGGGIYSANSSSIFYNCTIANNSAGNGGGFFRGSWTPIPTLQNCILWNNQPNQIDATSYPINLTYSNIQGGWSGIGNIDADPCFVDAANNDYHLRSEGWYWDSERQRWDYDDVTSRCIDAGNPGTALGDELLTIPDDPNNEWGENLRINMGAYGGTAKASMPPYNWTLLGDLTNDGIVNYLDLTMQLEDWLRSAAEQPGDLNRDGMVNMIDYTIFAEDWL
ncbi:MAG: right-handed parallel beta-helix repeat-containing protein, partial [Planctomycetes bacterium]|nr:right-handed parallel beta-helix repeat-containing protein [Planctomycetota bacterium]